MTGEMVEQLILCGADIIKVGIGPGKYFLKIKFIKDETYSHKLQVL